MRVVRTVLAVFVLVSSSCGKREAPPAGYTPGLGEIMSLTQMRHSKLWFAGQAGNWELAAYEVDEIQEGLEDAARLHPTHKGAPLPIPALIEKIMSQPLRDVTAAVKKRDGAAFRASYDALTAACNSCHQAADFGFNVVSRPATNPYTNQVFEPTPAAPR